MDLTKMLGKKDKKQDPAKKDAKLNAIKEMRKMASEMVGEDLKSNLMPKSSVTVAADDKEDLEEGLEQAKDMLSDAPDMDDSEDPTLEELEEMEREIAEMKAKLKARI